MSELLSKNTFREVFSAKKYKSAKERIFNKKVMQWKKSRMKFKEGAETY